MHQQQHVRRTLARRTELAGVDAPSGEYRNEAGLLEVRKRLRAIDTARLLGLAIERMRIVLPIPDAIEMSGVLLGNRHAYEVKDLRVVIVGVAANGKIVSHQNGADV